MRLFRGKVWYHEPSRCSSSLFNAIACSGTKRNRRYFVLTRFLHPDPSQFVADWSVGQPLPKCLFTFTLKRPKRFLQKKLSIESAIQLYSVFLRCFGYCEIIMYREIHCKKKQF